MLTLGSNLTMEGLDLAVSDEVLQTKSSRTATFTLSSSSSSSSSSLYLKQNEHTPQTSIDPHILEHRILKHSQSLTLECLRRRPVIEDPYQLVPNLQILNNWMIVSLFLLDVYKKQTTFFNDRYSKQLFHRNKL
jgi:hypothetical protein